MKKAILAVLTLLMSVVTAWGQVATVGREFWVAFLPNAQTDSCSQYYLLTVPSRNGTLTVSNPNTGWSQTIPLVANTQTNIQVPCSQVYMDASGDNIHSTGLLVTSSVPISLYAENRSPQPISMDVTLVFPVQTLGKRYRIHTSHAPLTAAVQEADGAFAVLATEDFTHVTVRLTTTCSLGGNGPGTISYVLNRGEVLYFQSSSVPTYDLTHSLVVSDKDVAVFMGNSRPLDDTTVTEHLFLQALPKNAWGNEYFVLPADDDVHSEAAGVSFEAGATLVDFLTEYPSTTTFAWIDSSRNMALGILSPTIITSPEPIALCLYHTNIERWALPNTDDETKAGTALLPTNSSVKYAHLPFIEMDTIGGYQPHYHINISTHTADTALITLDGSPLQGFTAIPGSDYAYLRRQVSASDHILTTSADNGFMGTFYGITAGEGSFYALIGGTSDTSSIHQVSLSGCDTVWYAGSAYTEGGDYLVVNGSDTVQLHVELGHTTRSIERVELTNEDYQWIDGNTYSQSTDLTLVYTGADGCDSIVGLHLVIHHTDTAMIDTTHCGPINLYGQTYSNSGIYEHVVYHGDDYTVYRIVLQIYPTYDITQYFTLSYDGMFWMDGIWYESSTTEPLVAYTTENGCDSIIRLNLVVHRDEVLWVPNAFMPEAEYNNRFVAKGIGIDHFEMWIFNRWGLAIWHSDNLDEGWDGTSQGKAMPKGTYVYKIQYTSTENPGNELSNVGTVTLLR